MQALQPGYPFSLFTDASGKGLGVVLSQVTPEGKKPVQYLSQKLTPAEHKYATIENETLAVNWVIGVLCYSRNGPCLIDMAASNERLLALSLVPGPTALRLHY